MSDLSNSLSDFAERIREINEASLAAQRLSIEKAHEAGAMLCHAKDRCPHGQWMPFLERAGIHDRQARRLMQIASAGIQIGHVSKMGGIKATLAYLAKLKLPPEGDILYISREESSDGSECAWIEHAKGAPGMFNVTSIKAHDKVFDLERPISGTTERLPSGGYYNALWNIVELMVDIPHDEREFTVMPAELLAKVNDCPFLDDMAEPTSINDIDVENAPLPLSYVAAEEALARCEDALTEDNLEALRRAIGICQFRSEKWPRGLKMVGTYSRISGDDRLSKRMEKIHSLALLKWGSLPGGTA